MQKVQDSPPCFLDTTCRENTHNMSKTAGFQHADLNSVLGSKQQQLKPSEVKKGRFYRKILYNVHLIAWSSAAYLAKGPGPL